MIHRPNFDLVHSFLDYHRDTLQHDAKTVRRYWVSLRHLIEWCDATPFPTMRNRKPAYPAYLLTKVKENGQPLSIIYMTRILKDARYFLLWCKRERTSEFREMTQQWIEGLRLPRAKAESAQLDKFKAYSLDEIRELMDVPAETLVQRRDRAAVAFLYLSAMRIAAFCSLPISCVHVAKRRIEQLPAKGVLTKNSKAAITTLLRIDDLLAIVNDWDEQVQTALPATSMWYPRAPYRHLVMTSAVSAKGMGDALRLGMQLLCEKAGVEYKGPHALRHGHALYGMQHAKTIEDLKALSLNMMHSNISITDGLYGSLSPENINSTLGGFGTAVDSGVGLPDTVTLMRQLLDALERNRE